MRQLFIIRFQMHHKSPAPLRLLLAETNTNLLSPVNDLRKRYDVAGADLQKKVITSLVVTVRTKCRPGDFIFLPRHVCLLKQKFVRG